MPGLPPFLIDQLMARVHQQRLDLAVVDIDGLEYTNSALELLIVLPPRQVRGSARITF